MKNLKKQKNQILKMTKKMNIKMIKKIFFFLIVTILFTSFSKMNFNQNDVIPDEKTAIKVAEAIWLPRFGKIIYKSKPFKATLEKDSIWHVKGTLPKKHFGGVPHAFISKKNGRIISFFHGK